ncbi:MAG: type II secretion system GspH family protein [Vallitaleaceae bacterium]|nr:type II secretion system GspH family protein [Vallitaleaceae bacterium]
MKKFVAREQGFTLIEIIISIALLSVVSVIVLRLFVLSYTINEDAKISDGANTLIVNQLETMKTYDHLDTFLSAYNWLDVTPNKIQGQLFYDDTFSPIDKESRFTLHWSMVKNASISGLYQISTHMIDTTTNETLTTYTTQHYFKHKE